MNNNNKETNLDLISKELDWFLRSKRPIIQIISHEEQRVMGVVKSVCSNTKVEWVVIEWDIVNGLLGSNNDFIPASKENRMLDQIEVLQWFDGLDVPKNQFVVLVLKDYNKFFGTKSIQGQIEHRIIRHLRNISHECITKNKAIILLSAELDIPKDLEKSVAILDFPLPEKEHIHNKVSEMLKKASQKKELVEKLKINYSSEEMEEIVSSFLGLTLDEVEQTCAYCMIKVSKLDPKTIIQQKKEIIKKSSLLEWIDVDESLSNIGGLDSLKYWLEKRKNAFSEEASEYGLPSNPKGLLLVGVMGAGKSLFARSIATHWKMPLLRLDMGKVFSGIVGSSEQNMRQVFKLAESIAPAILWCDEIEKGMSGSKGSSSSDGGTTSRVLGSWLTWMQEKTAPVFVVATANDISQLPAEMLRKGRFDEIFFVDLPEYEERKTIFEIHLNKRNRNISKFDISELAEISEGFTGAEIEAAIVSALYESFSDSMRDLNNDDIIYALKETVPISVTMQETIEGLRDWASNRARNASKKISKKVKTSDTIIQEEEDL